MGLTTAIFQFLRKGHFMFSPLPFLELEVRNTPKTREAWREVIKISGLTRLLVSEKDFLSGAETTPAHYLSNLVLGVSGSTEQKNPSAVTQPGPALLPGMFVHPKKQETSGPNPKQHSWQAL